MLDKLKHIDPNMLVLIGGGVLAFLILLTHIIQNLKEKNKVNTENTVPINKHFSSLFIKIFVAGTLLVTLIVATYFIYTNFYKKYTLNDNAVACKSIDGREAYLNTCDHYFLGYTDVNNYLLLKKYDCTILHTGTKVKLLNTIKVKTSDGYTVVYAKIKTNDKQIYVLPLMYLSKK